MRQGVAHQKAKRLPEAIAAFRKVIELEGTSCKLRSRAFTALGLAMATAGDKKGAIEAWMRAHEEDPTQNRTAYSNMTAGLRQRGVLGADGRLDFGKGAETPPGAGERGARLRKAFVDDLPPCTKGLLRVRVQKKYTGGPGAQAWFTTSALDAAGGGAAAAAAAAEPPARPSPQTPPRKPD